MYKSFNIKENTIEFINECEIALNNDFSRFDSIYEHNQLKVLNSFIKNKISDIHFIHSTGYGYNDIGRDIIEKVYSDIFHTEDALVRQQIVSGTHAICISLFSICRPGDEILSINGLPYDTLHTALGINNSNSSLDKFGITFKYVDLDNEVFNKEKIKNNISKSTKLIMIQRSRGYSDRHPFSIDQIKDIISFIKDINLDVIILVDNCYGEFVDTIEPTDVGADIMCGSLIKNPGGGLAQSGGYIVGKKNLIELCSERLTAPGIAKEVGVNFNQNRNVLQGLYFAPQIVINSLKIDKLFAYTLNKLGILTIPSFNESFNDIVLAVKLNDKNKLIKFCNIIQSTSPVDSYLKPLSTQMPGYDNEVIMAAGCFISGSSIELSCDAPIREPYIAYLQGGLTYYQGKLALMKVIEELELL